MAIVIRQVRPDDQDSLLHLFGEVFGNPRTFDRRWAWAYGENPERRPGQISHWVAEDEGRIIGCMSGMPAGLSIQGHSHRVQWIQNLTVHPDYRGQGVAKRMYREGFLPRAEVYLGVGSTDPALGLWLKEGAIPVAADREVAYYLPSRFLLRQIVADAGAARIRDLTRTARSTALSVRDAMMRGRRRRGSTTVREVTHFDSRFDSFWEEMQQSIPVLTRRDSRNLNWRYANPTCRYRAFVAEEGDRLRGFLVLREDGVLMDLLVRTGDRDSFRTLLGAAVAHCRENGRHRLSGIEPGFRPLAALYREAGFLETGYRVRLLAISAPGEDVATALSCPSNWYLSMGDSDLFLY